MKFTFFISNVIDSEYNYGNVIFSTEFDVVNYNEYFIGAFVNCLEPYFLFENMRGFKKFDSSEVISSHIEKNLGNFTFSDLLDRPSNLRENLFICSKNDIINFLKD